MAVYKKDGSVYKLNGPNNLMVSQEKWGSFVGHNLKNLSNFKMESAVSHVVIETKKEEKIIPPKENVEIINNNSIHGKNEFEGFPKTIMHCALAEYVEQKDSLYNDVFIKKKYVDSFTFECIIISINDFVLSIWTTTNKLAVGSVLYPQNDSKRWWEIKEIENVPGGYKAICVTTKNTLAF